MLAWRDANMPGKPVWVTEWGWDAAMPGETCATSLCVSQHAQVRDVFAHAVPGQYHVVCVCASSVRVHAVDPCLWHRTRCRIPHGSVNFIPLHRTPSAVLTVRGMTVNGHLLIDMPSTCTVPCPSSHISVSSPITATHRSFCFAPSSQPVQAVYAVRGLALLARKGVAGSHWFFYANGGEWVVTIADRRHSQAAHAQTADYGAPVTSHTYHCTGSLPLA